ncbi:MAG: hypothetical protein ACRDL5_15220, partial [Solirubrobacteraceae bacterium]
AMLCAVGAVLALLLRSGAPKAAVAAPPAAPTASTPEPAVAVAPAPAAAPAAAVVPAPARQPLGEAADLERRLIASGFTKGNAAGLILATVSGGDRLAEPGALSRRVRATIARSLSAPRPVPSGHGAVAIVGAGGSGKTRTVAALAAAHARGGGLVSVASLGAPGREAELGALLRREPVNVIPAMRTRATARAVASARDRGLVVIDTASVAPADSATLDVLAEALDGFRLDSVYLTVPATVSLTAGTKLVDGFSAFDLTGLIATHVDEADQLGVLVELATTTGIPLSYTLSGRPLADALASADPVKLAEQLL